MRQSVLLASLCLLMALAAPARSALAESPQAAHITLGHSTEPLNRPWRFHVGDDDRWSAPDFDDSAWETVDLTPAPGAHDGDVGLPGYVTGWSQRGHAHYSGYAWYRINVAVENDNRAPLALAGPTLVDSTYQLYVNGKLLGGPGVFSDGSPTVLSVRPRVFPLPATTSENRGTYVIAIRVWMDPADGGEESGGIHVAPIIGDAQSIEQLHQVQWFQTFKGYVADAIEPLAFVVLAIMVIALIASRTGDAYRWLVTALALLALLRVNQVLYFWTPYLSLRGYDIAVTVILRPSVLAAWTLAWRDWFQLDRRPWLVRTIGALTVAYLVLALMERPWFAPDTLHGLKAASGVMIKGIRLAFAALYLWVLILGVARSPRLLTWLGALAAMLVGIGLFATELNALGIPGIWFPYGTGVARGQFAYAAFIAILFGLILSRSIGYARRR